MARNPERRVGEGTREAYELEAVPDADGHMWLWRKQSGEYEHVPPLPMSEPESDEEQWLKNHVVDGTQCYPGYCVKWGTEKHICFGLHLSDDTIKCLECGAYPILEAIVEPSKAQVHHLETIIDEGSGATARRAEVQLEALLKSLQPPPTPTIGSGIHQRYLGTGLIKGLAVFRAHICFWGTPLGCQRNFKKSFENKRNNVLPTSFDTRVGPPDIYTL
jgi:hypothetical protein